MGFRISVGTRLNKKATSFGVAVVVNRFERAGVALYDVIFLTGAVGMGITESELTGASWAVLEGKADLAELLQLVELAKGVARESSARQKLEQLAHQGEAARLRKSPDNAHLTPGDDLHSGLLAAKNIRRALVYRFPGVAFRVRKKGFGCVLVCWTGGPPVELVEDLVTSHTKRSAFASVFGGAGQITYKRVNNQAHG